MAKSANDLQGWIEKDMELNWHTWVTQHWDEITNPIGSVEEKAKRLATIYAEQRGKPLNSWRVKRHVLRKLTLDLVCASFPDGNPPSETIIKLLKLALELPDTHEVGGWPVTAGIWDDRGEPDHEARNTAMLLDLEYIEVHDDYMPLRTLQRGVKAKLGRVPDRKTLRRWRSSQVYWGNHWSPPKGGGK